MVDVYTFPPWNPTYWEDDDEDVVVGPLRLRFSG